MDIIFCYGCNKKLGEIAVNLGYKYGARYPCSVPFELFFADQNWNRPNRIGYMKFLKKHNPVTATVLDLDSEDKFDDVMSWAYEASEFVRRDIIIIPKITNIINKLPHQIGGKRVVLGYSVPSNFGKTDVCIEEFERRHIHLLGGSIKRQITAFETLIKISSIVSIDGNYIARKTWLGQTWSQNNKKYGSWKQARDNRNYLELFKESGINILNMWKEKHHNLWNYKFSS